LRDPQHVRRQRMAAPRLERGQRQQKVPLHQRAVRYDMIGNQLGGHGDIKREEKATGSDSSTEQTGQESARFRGEFPPNNLGWPIVNAEIASRSFLRSATAFLLATAGRASGVQICGFGGPELPRFAAA